MTALSFKKSALLLRGRTRTDADKNPNMHPATIRGFVT